jgi:site-specific recombinase XerD
MVNPFNKAILTQFEQYLTDISLSPKTIASYLTDLNVFTRWATETYSDNFSLVEVTPDQIRTYLTYLLDDLERAPSTVNRHLQALRKCCAYITEVNLAPSNAAEEISLVSLKNQYKPGALSQQNIAALLESASEARSSIAKRDVAILRLLLNTGLRVAEVIDLQMDDVVFDYPGVHLRVRDSRGLGTRDIPLSPEVCRSLKDYLLIRSKTAASPHVFLTQEGKPLSSRTVQRIVSRCAKKARLSRVTPQLLRRTYAVHLLQETGDLDLVTRRLGHQTPAITLRYLNLEETEKEALMNKN